MILDVKTYELFLSSLPVDTRMKVMATGLSDTDAILKSLNGSDLSWFKGALKKYRHELAAKNYNESSCRLAKFVEDKSTKSRNKIRDFVDSACIEYIKEIKRMTRKAQRQSQGAQL